MKAEFFLISGELIDIGGHYEIVDGDVDIFDIFVEVREVRIPIPASLYELIKDDLYRAAENTHRAYLDDSAEVMREIDDYYRRAI